MSDKPHVLLITTDHWLNSLLGVSGHPVIQTPTLDALARNGTRFTRAYSECPVCAPARKTLMTGRAPRFNESLSLDGLPTLAQTFRDAGYQAYAAGKLHVHPQRSRIGFDDVMLAEEGRIQDGAIDDYELFLGDRGYVGQQFAHGVSNNDYFNREWLYGQYGEDTEATRMIHDGRFKLIYYAVGNCFQLFDLRVDPKELNNLVDSQEHAEVRTRLTHLLINEFYGTDVNWVQGDAIVGLPNRTYSSSVGQRFSGQRGVHWPLPPS